MGKMFTRDEIMRIRRPGDVDQAQRLLDLIFEKDEESNTYRPKNAAARAALEESKMATRTSTLEVPISIRA